MSEWWTYRPDDFLLFSQRVYWRMFELHNEAVWPLHLATLSAGFAVVLLALRSPQRHALWIAFILASLWAFVGWSFLWNRYAGINWAIVYVAPAFWLQALLLVVTGTMGSLAFDLRDVTGRLGLLLAAVGLVAYPLLQSPFGRSWASSEVVGIAPDPTVITTLGILLAAGGRLMPVLLPIPLLWLVLSGLTLRAMGDAQAWVPIAAALTSASLVMLRWFLR